VLQTGFRRGLAELGIEEAEPEDADVILLVESLREKFREHADALLHDPLVRRYPDRCFVFDQTDRPLPFLPGVYVSLDRRLHEEHRTRPVPNWGAIFQPADVEPERLFSFSGYPSSPVRERMLAAGIGTATTRFWDYDGDERNAYAHELRSSRFVLCPRGRGASTARLYETMQVGRAPVVVSDAWAPPAIGDWSEFSLRVAERDVESLPEILAAREADAAELGSRAARAWEERCRPGAPLVRFILEEIASIRAARLAAGWDETAFRRLWHSHGFRWRHGIHPVQGAVASARRGELASRLSRRKPDAGPRTQERP
jgi:hypothetical protein